MPRAKAEAPRAWQRMLSGRRLDLLDPSSLDIEIEDIAHGLARVARWNGQTNGDHAFSVAQHCVLVEQIAFHVEPKLDRHSRLATLLHDADAGGDRVVPSRGDNAVRAQNLGPHGGAAGRRLGLDLRVQ